VLWPLLAIVGIHLSDELQAGAAVEPSARAGCQFDLPEKTETYEILR
jgi:hypothetical protein